MSRSRDLSWDGCLNVRDLGGLPTLDGDETRFGRIVRADSVRQLTDAGWEAALAYGIRTIVDLRGDHERDRDPPAEIPIEVQHVPFMEADADGWTEIEGRVEAVARAAPDDGAATRDVYMIFLEHFRVNAAAGVRAVARAPKGGVVIHCMGGKDRTGLLAALVLHLAGVPAPAIAADYALSEVRLRPRHDEWLAQAETEAERERLRQIARTPAEGMVGVLAELGRRYGGVDQFLRGGGVSDEDLALAGARLRG
jgi:protein tyrosine/serine phosphatase